MKKEPDAMINLKTLKADLAGLLTERAVAGLTVEEACVELAKREQYAGFEADHMHESVTSMLASLAHEGQAVGEETRKGDRYRPA
jgi:hypothetical protein